MTFSEQLQKIIDHDGLTQKEVAAICHISRSTVSEYVNGKQIPSYENAVRIFQALGYDLRAIRHIESKSGQNHNLRENASGYYDPTAYKAIKKADSDRGRMLKLLDTILTICEYAGFHVEERIVLKDKKTGKIWR